MIIMIKTDKQLKVPKWSKNEINRWADYIELRCLYMDDHLVSKDDVLDIFIDEGIIELVYIVLQSVVKPGITGFFKIDLHIKCYIYLS